MTGSNVMNLLSVQSGYGKAGEVKSGSKDANEVFGQLVSGIQQNFNCGRVNDKFSSLETKVDTDTSANTEYQKYQYRDSKIKNSTPQSVEEKADEVKETLENTKEELKQTIAEALGVEEEQIEEVLGQLGFGIMDLLDPKNLVLLVQKITGIQELPELLVSEDFLNLFSQVTEIAKQLVSETGFSLEELKVLDSYLEENTSFEQKLNTLVEGDMGEKSKEPVENESLEQTDELAAEQEKNVPENEKAAIDEGWNEEKTIADVKANATKNGNKESFDDSLTKGNEPVISVTDNGELKQTVSFTEFVNQISSYTEVDTEAIMKQMVERIRFSVEAQETSIEMQLNPESLGKVYVNLSSKEGTVSAQIYTANETVKEALEMQVLTLKENLNQAGVKVDAVEVSVGTHEFERNLEQDQKREEENGKYQEEIQSKRRRSLTLDSLDELSGIMSEEEALILQMMRDNGNSVDLTA